MTTSTAKRSRRADDRAIERALDHLPERLEHVLRREGGGSVATAAQALFPGERESVATRRVRRWIAPSGQRHRPELDAVVALGVRFGVDLNWLLLGKS